VCIVTGSNSGIGKRVALQLAELGATVVMACRSRERGEAALAEVKRQSGSDAVALMLVDLSSQQSIRRFVEEFQRTYSQLHVLINNAANFDHTLTRPVLTEDGVETIFATNHLGPFLMTHLLLDRLKASAPSRIINVASKGLVTYPFLGIEFDNLNGERKFSTQHAYYLSKQAQVMFTYDLARRLEATGVTVNCIRVTNVQIDHGRYEYLSGLKRSLYEIKRRFAVTPEKMAETYVYLAASPEVEGVSGRYFDENNRQVRSNKKSYDAAIWQRLWNVSAKLTGLNGLVRE
jgi:NAD(P)-dependent dehydrogenase (short-subunit alcohol dehydrogenase family)